MFVKTAFPALKLKFLACSMKQAFYLPHKQNITQENTFVQAFRSVSGCQTCMLYKRSIKHPKLHQIF